MVRVDEILQLAKQKEELESTRDLMTKKVVYVIDIDAEEDFCTESVEIQALHKNGAWLKIIEVQAGDFGFTPGSDFFHRVFRVVKSGHISQENEEPTTIPEV